LSLRNQHQTRTQTHNQFEHTQWASQISNLRSVDKRVLLYRVPSVTTHVTRPPISSRSRPGLVLISRSRPDLVQVSSWFPDLVPISSRSRPDLVPISSRSRPHLVGFSFRHAPKHNSKLSRGGQIPVYSTFSLDEMCGDCDTRLP
jgi:hypothetical protein